MNEHSIHSLKRSNFAVPYPRPFFAFCLWQFEILFLANTRIRYTIVTRVRCDAVTGQRQASASKRNVAGSARRGAWAERARQLEALSLTYQVAGHSLRRAQHDHGRDRTKQNRTRQLHVG